MKASQIRTAAASKKSYKIEETENQIGISFSGSVWHWFSKYGDDCFFDHSYSTNTGMKREGLGFKVIEKIKAA